jgi:hypothetical protein
MLILAGSAVMVYVVLKAIGQSAMVVVSENVITRRAREAQRRAEDAAAEAAGRVAALEPLALNPDGSIQEPILAQVELRN